MMLRANGLMLDFNEDIEIEKHSKVFEEIDATVGDFSYSFSLQKTSRNLQILGIESVDLYTKRIYSAVECDVLDNDGVPVYRGQLRVERINTQIECSFFSGNYNWISLLTGSVQDLDLSEYTTDVTEANIQSSWSNTEGITFPLIDNGPLITRGHKTLLVEDFNAGVYLKTLFKKIFQGVGIKINGELIDEPLYNSIIVCKNNKSQSDIDANSTFAEKTSTTARPVENDFYKVTFQNDSTYPYFDGDNDNFDITTSTYTAPVKMQVIVEVSLRPSIVDSSYNNRIYLYINGVFTFVDIGLAAGGLYNSATPGDQDLFTLKRRITLNAGDTLEIYSQWQQSLGSTQNDVLSGTLKITPVFIYQVTGGSLLPAWTKQEFVANVLNLFNVVSDYDPVSKELTFNFFDRIKQKTPTDLSQYIQVVESDFEEFISNYARRNNFKYNEGSDEQLEEYNVTKFLKYGTGVIQVDNDFIEESKDIIDSDFTAPVSYINTVFGASLERVNFFDVEKSDSTQITSVVDNSGTARFNITDDIFLVGDLIRIENSVNNKYNGDYLVTVRAAGYIEVQGLGFDTDSTATISRLTYNYSTNDDVYLFVNIPNYTISNFSTASPFYLGTSTKTAMAYAFFNLLDTGAQVNTDFKQSLSFGTPSGPFTYQRTLLDTYWSNFGDILGDPVKLRAIANLPKNVFLQLTPLNPVFIKTIESSNLYYVNQILGYKNSYQPCEIQLIKL